VLIIEVLNAREVVRKRVGKLGERLIGKVVDADKQVEKALMQEMEAAFQEFGIEARILSVQGPRIEDAKYLQLPLDIRHEKKVQLKN